MSDDSRRRGDDVPSSEEWHRPADRRRRGADESPAVDPFAEFEETHRGALPAATRLDPRAPHAPVGEPAGERDDSAAASRAAPGRVAFVLHAHLPWVLGHGRWPHGESWLTEAALHCYLPLTDLLRRLGDKGRRRLLTLSVTPVLAAQLADERLREAVDEEIAARLGGARVLAARHPGGRWWVGELERIEGVWRALDGDLLGAWRDLAERDVVELSTAAATHPYLPLLHRAEHVRLQLAVARENHRRWFGEDPRGIWMPECAYRPGGPWENPASGGKEAYRAGSEAFLEEAGFRWTVADAHLLLGGEPFLGYGFPWVDDPRAELPPLPEDEEAPLAERLQPVWIEESEIAAFFREPHTARQVWARQMGYPGDPAYLDFHKRHEDNGLRLWRVTDAEADLADKLPYWPDEAAETVTRQADHFVFLLENLPGLAGGVALCPYDAELFGHWWYEGPRWLEATLERIADHPGLVTTTPSRELEAIPRRRQARLDEGSWGEGGDHRVWLNDETEWMWRDLKRAETAAAELLRSAPAPERARAALRQLMLMASSDWPFLLTMGTASDYAIRRFQLHRDRFQTLIETTDREPLPDWARDDLAGLEVEPDWWSEGDA